MGIRSKVKAERVACALMIALAIVLLGFVWWGGSKLFKLVVSGSGSGERVPVPSVLGQGSAEAETTLTQVGLIIGDIMREHSDSTEAGLIYRQDPEAGTMRKPGASVEIYVSLGTGNFIAPDLTGTKIEHVVAALADANLSLGRTTRLYNKRLPPGLVVNQDPPPMMERTSSFSVNVFWTDNTNPPDVSMPLLTGKSFPRASQTLHELGLQLRKVNYVVDDSVVGGVVLRQSVPAAKTIKLGDQVELDIAIPSGLHESRTKTIYLSVAIPSGPPEQRVKVKVFDALSGSSGKVEVDQIEKPGSKVERLLELEGSFTVLVFIDDMENPYREERLQ